MSTKRVAALVALVLCIGLVVVALLPHRLPAWLALVGGVGALGALRAAATQPERCPKCRAYAGRAFHVEMTMGKNMYGPKNKTPRHLQDNRTTGWSESSYRCSKCQNEWKERRVIETPAN